MRLHLVRHAAVTVRPQQPNAAWHLSPQGREGASRLGEQPFWANLAVLYTSAEPKAVGTAQRLASSHELAIRIEPDLGEVRRGWVEEGYQDLVRRYLAGEALDGWEPREAALRRFRAAVDGILVRHSGKDVGLVSHGLVLTQYLSDLLGLDREAAYELWSKLRFPDLAVLDPEAKRFEREFGHIDA